MGNSSIMSNRLIKMPPNKRRRLSTSSSVTSASDVASPNIPSPTADYGIMLRGQKTGSVSCNGCHKYFNIGTDSKLGRIISCPRCHSMSCSVCSRVCNACPPSIPSTPLLSYSPTPPMTPLGSPSRRCQTLHPENTPTLASANIRDDNRNNRKKKRNIEDMENIYVSEDIDFDIVNETEAKNIILSAGTGCGRTLCRNCCVDNPQTFLTTCYDCYGLIGVSPAVC